MSENAPRGTVVVLSWNGRELLERCLPPLLTSMAVCEGRWELVVVDNGSTDGSVEVVRERFPTARLIENADNRGFSAAANQGIATARGEYVALVNNDVLVTERWLAELVAVLEATPTDGSAAAQMRYLRQPDIINSAGIDVDVTGRAFDRRDGHRAIDEPALPEVVFGASGGAVVYRRRMLEELGGLEERFFAYVEDVDLAWRAQRAGWTCHYVPTSVVYHEHAATSDRVAGLRTYLSVRNHWWLLARNASAIHLVVASPAVLALATWTVIVALARRNFAGPRGLRDAIADLPAVRRTRPRGPSLPLHRFTAPGLLRHRRAARILRERPGG